MCRLPESQAQSPETSQRGISLFTKRHRKICCDYYIILFISSLSRSLLFTFLAAVDNVAKVVGERWVCSWKSWFPVLFPLVTHVCVTFVCLCFKFIDRLDPRRWDRHSFCYLRFYFPIKQDVFTGPEFIILELWSFHPSLVPLILSSFLGDIGTISP